MRFRAVLLVDAEFDPASAADTNGQVSEIVGVAQTFTVVNDGRLERFWLLLTQGVSVDTGIIRITVRPVVGGLPDASPASRPRPCSITYPTSRCYLSMRVT